MPVCALKSQFRSFWSFFFAQAPVLGSQVPFFFFSKRREIQKNKRSNFLGNTLALVARAIRNTIRANRFAIENPIFIVRQADSHESLEFPIHANHPIRANRANRFARITPLRRSPWWRTAPLKSPLRGPRSLGTRAFFAVSCAVSFPAFRDGGLVLYVGPAWRACRRRNLNHAQTRGVAKTGGIGIRSVRNDLPF